MRNTFVLTQEELDALVEMRELQTRYHAGERHLLGRAKAAERRVDRLLARFAPPKPTATEAEPTLFAPEPPIPQPTQYARIENEPDDEPSPWWGGLN